MNDENGDLDISYLDSLILGDIPVSQLLVMQSGNFYTVFPGEQVMRYDQFLPFQEEKFLNDFDLWDSIESYSLDTDNFEEGIIIEDGDDDSVEELLSLAVNSSLHPVPRSPPSPHYNLWRKDQIMNIDNSIKFDPGKSKKVSKRKRKQLKSKKKSLKNIKASQVKDPVQESATKQTLNPTVEEYKGKIMKMTKNQKGCRALQNLLETEDRSVYRMIFDETVESIPKIMIDPFGNYFAQKLFCQCDAQDRIRVIHMIPSDIVKISKSAHGTRAIQTLVQFLETDEEFIEFGKVLKKHVITLIKHLNGNHVVQLFIQRAPTEIKQFVFDILSDHCIEVSSHQQGCCVFQRCIDNGSPIQQKQLTQAVISNARQLVQNPYANYVVQYVLENNYEIRDLPLSILQKMRGRLISFSKQKFSSNVIEKCLKRGDQRSLKLFVDELLASNNVSSTLLSLMIDSYGNYVIQTLLVETKIKCESEYHKLVKDIEPVIPSLKKRPCARRIKKILKN
eukprot:TRINITY_DN5343_c0_g1_i1.p1 TRINITY_DN5343_c0_g1~~TRINITY_DN5343_c0_g1_i1.p1  ORF type:complete len:506 (+),score=96.54 TRINITY_DN5343_c0_g1_i1:358-1875(+)